jgi:hypothetical protein
MSRPRTPQELEPEDSSGAGPSAPPRADPGSRIQTLTGGYLARHPTLLKVLEGLGWNNPGGGMNP